MLYIAMLILGLFGGGLCVFLLLTGTRLQLKEQKNTQDAQRKTIQEAIQQIRARQKEIDQRGTDLNVAVKAKQEELAKQAADLNVAVKAKQEELAKQAADINAAVKAKQEELTKRTEDLTRAYKVRQDELAHQAAQLKAQQDEFNVRVVSYKELLDENATLKRDLQNMDVNLRKLQLDTELQRHAQEALSEKVKELGSRYLKENVKWIGSSLTPNNFAACKQRLQDVIERCRGIGFGVPTEEEDSLIADLKSEFEKMVRAALEREEQARIKARIREEQLLEREVERELKQLERERAAIQGALEKALADAKDQHTEEVDRLKARLAEAEAKAQRAMSRAQMTKSGYIYVISNIGSFGEGLFKIGMTRRLEPSDRVRELGDASVPFPFDVHMMISSDDAPTLENAIHRALHKLRVNKIKPRKEFFKTDIEAVRQIVLEHHGEVQYVADPEALEYRQSLSMSDEDAKYIESVYDAEDEEAEGHADDQ